MDYNRIYRQQVKDLENLLQMPPHQLSTLVIATESDEKSSDRLTRYWLDLNQSTLSLHHQIFKLRQPEVERRFFRFGALLAFFPPSILEHDLLFQGIWLWHFAPFTDIPALASLIYDAHRRLQEMISNVPLLNNALIFFHLVGLDFFYETFIPQILPVLNEQLADTVLVRVFSAIIMYSIAKSLRVQYIQTVCTDNTLELAGRYRIEYGHFGLTTYQCTAFLTPLSPDEIVKKCTKIFGSIFPIINLNIFNRVLTSYLIIPPEHLEAYRTLFRTLQESGYLISFSILPITVNLQVQYDADLSPRTALLHLLEFNSLQLFTFKNPDKWQRRLRQVLMTEYATNRLPYPTSAAQVAFLYNICMVLPSNHALNGDHLTYDHYTKWMKKSFLPYDEFLSILTQLRANNSLTLDRYNVVYMLKSLPSFLTCWIAFPSPQPYMQDLLSQFTLGTTDSQWIIGTFLSTMFFPFWMAQCYWNCQYMMVLQIYSMSKALDYSTFAMQYEELQLNGGIKVRSPVPIVVVHPLYPILTGGDPLTHPIPIRPSVDVLRDFLEIRPYSLLYNALYSMMHVRSHKLHALFTAFFDAYFHVNPPLSYLNSANWETTRTHLFDVLDGNRTQIKQFLTAALPLQRIFPTYLHTQRILIILTAYCNLHPQYLVADQFLQGIFQWGLLSCQYHTTNFQSLLLLEYDLPRTFYDNPKSTFNRFWTKCRQRYGDQLHITIEPIMSSRYNCQPKNFADHQLLLRSFSLKNLTACEFCINPNDLIYYYSESIPSVSIPQSELNQYLISADGIHSPPESLQHLPIWWHDWCSPSFFLMTLASLRALFLIQKNTVWESYKRQILNFCQQFPAMYVTETASYLLIELHLTGVIRDTLTFVVAQFVGIHLPFDLLLPVDARMFGSTELQTFLTWSRAEYPIRLISGEIIEEPLFHPKSVQTLYSLLDRVRIHTIMRQLLQSFPQRMTISAWRQCLQHLETIFITSPPLEADLEIYQQVEVLLFQISHE